ncbi:MAG: collagen-like protein [Chromatiaceae bacterium]|nr:collagen-like protein [Chromatiaceae bacterium]
MIGIELAYPAAGIDERLALAETALQPGDVPPASIEVAVSAADKTAIDLITDQAAGAFGLTLDTATLYQWDDHEWVLLTPIRGETGAVGSEGPEGPEGPQGPAGPAGQDGASTFAALTDVDPTEEPDGQVLTTASGVATWAAPTGASTSADLADFTSGAATSGQVPTADGAGGVAWADLPDGAQPDLNIYRANSFGGF